MKYIYEACVENFSGAKIAEHKGANRVELCDNLAVGGTTPSFATIEMTQKYLTIPQAVIVRARGGDFIYSNEEKEIMLKDVEMINSLGVDSIVVGALDGQYLDKQFLTQCREIAKNCKIVCHMAFDDTENLNNSLDLLISLGYDRVLTKGGHGKAIQNLDILKQLVHQANNKITILVGGGVTKDNVQDIANYTCTMELHGKLIV